MDYFPDFSTGLLLSFILSFILPFTLSSHLFSLGLLTTTVISKYRNSKVHIITIRTIRTKKERKKEENWRKRRINKERNGK